jgi:hypothetical protein
VASCLIHISKIQASSPPIKMVEDIGLEPITYGLQSRRSPR